jgi:hypothetical protein
LDEQDTSVMASGWRPYGVVLSGPSEVLVAPQKEHRIPFSLENIGENADSYDIVIEGDTQWVTGTDLPKTVTLDSGQSATLLIYVEIPANATNQTEARFTLRARSVGSPSLAESASLQISKSPMRIDVRPNSDENRINSKGRGVIPIAVLGSADFAVTDLRWDSIRLVANGLEPVHDNFHDIEDINYDGFGDLMLHFSTRGAELTEGLGMLCLYAESFGGARLGDCDFVHVR